MCGLGAIRGSNDEVEYRRELREGGRSGHPLQWSNTVEEHQDFTAVRVTLDGVYETVANIFCTTDSVSYDRDAIPCGEERPSAVDESGDRFGVESISLLILSTEIAFAIMIPRSWYKLRDGLTLRATISTFPKCGNRMSCTN
jgi:hypothetical protein